MITNIIDILLIVGILYMLYLIHQITPYYFVNNKINNNQTEPTNNTTFQTNNNEATNNNLNQIVKSNEKLDEIMPVTEHGFHDHFAELNGFETNQHLGWRYWYLKNKSNYNVKSTGNFEDVPTKNYLNGLENTHNWFENLDENTDMEQMVIE